jgi:hypothetical protein
MGRRAATIVSLALCLALAPGVGQAHSDSSGGRTKFLPGARGVGDPYFPLDGNGGYDVRHYLLDVTYDPATDNLIGEATIKARATQNLSSFNLDFEGLTVRSIKVDGRPATWSRDGGELTVVPRRGLDKHKKFTTVVRYDGIPATIDDPRFGQSGFFHTDDGAIVSGQPDVAATWFPANDHPIDKASYTFKITVPSGLEAIANGVLERSRERHGRTTWTWDAREPMASYLAMMAIGEFDVRAYRENGIRFWDALDPDLFVPVMPRTGDRFAISQVADESYKRLTHVVTVPDTGAELSFWITRETEVNWDFVFVEAHTVGLDNWTTLADLNGHNSQDTGFGCPSWLGVHPFLAHYQSDNGDDTCSPTGSTGAWWAATGASDGYEQWLVDLSAFEGDEVEVSISYASDGSVQGSGLVVDDVVVSNGPGTTSFEDDGDLNDGWTVPGPPAESAPNTNDWIFGTAADTPPTIGEVAEGSFARQGEIIDFLAGNFGPYPFSASGGIVDDLDELIFPLENQTRPIYSKDSFGGPISADSVVVHTLAHQWYGDSLALESWEHIWLNEGFATYAEWLWSEHEGLGSPQENFDFYMEFVDADDPFWDVRIGDPGADALFDFSVNDRGAMTLQQLRVTVGDDDFFKILRRWSSSQAGGNVTTDEFIALAERISHQQLDELFETWLTPGKPEP